MNKESKPTNEKHPALDTIPAMQPSLDSAVMAAIQAAVANAVTAIVSQMTPVQPLNVQQAPIAVKPTRLNPNPPTNIDYRTKLVGIPVEPGQDLRHVHPSEINAWFRGIEERAKERLRKQGLSNGTQASMNWTREW